MKKLAVLLAASLLALGLAACASTGASSAGSAGTAESSNIPEDGGSTDADLPAGTTPFPMEMGSPVPDTEMSVDPIVETPDAALSETLDAIYAIHEAGIPVATRAVDTSDTAWVGYYTGLVDEDTAAIDAAVASEAEIGSQAYSVVLVRVKEGADVPALAEKMLNGINPAKWVCVQGDDLRVVSSGNTILLAMMDSSLSDVVTSSAIIDAYRQVTGADFDYDATREVTFDAEAAPGPL